jgi:hypothetical protein
MTTIVIKPLVNAGTILADLQGEALTLAASGGLTNTGLLESASTLVVDDNVLDGGMLMDAGATLAVAGTVGSGGAAGRSIWWTSMAATGYNHPPRRRSTTSTTL